MFGRKTGGFKKFPRTTELQSFAQGKCCNLLGLWLHGICSVLPPPRSLFRLTSPSGVGYKTRTGVWGGGVYLKSTIQLSPFGLVRSLGVLQVTPSTASKAHHDTMTFLIFYGRTMQLLRVPSWCLSLWIYGIGTGRVSPAFFGVQQECGGNGCHHMARLTTIEGTDAKRYERLCCSLSRDGKWFRQSCRNRCPAFEPVEETSS